MFSSRFARGLRRRTGGSTSETLSSNHTELMPETIPKRSEKRAERTFLSHLQRIYPRCEVRRVSKDENWLFYRINSARRPGPIKGALLEDVHASPERKARDEARRYRVRT